MDFSISVAISSMSISPSSSCLALSRMAHSLARGPKASTILAPVRARPRSFSLTIPWELPSKRSTMSSSNCSGLRYLLLGTGLSLRIPSLIVSSLCQWAKYCPRKVSRSPGRSHSLVFSPTRQNMSCRGFFRGGEDDGRSSRGSSASTSSSSWWSPWDRVGPSPSLSLSP